jgi:hypothetical protein
VNHIYYAVNHIYYAVNHIYSDKVQARIQIPMPRFMQQHPRFTLQDHDIDARGSKPAITVDADSVMFDEPPPKADAKEEDGDKNGDKNGGDKDADDKSNKSNFALASSFIQRSSRQLHTSKSDHGGSGKSSSKRQSAGKSNTTKGFCTIMSVLGVDPKRSWFWMRPIQTSFGPETT